MAQRATAGLGPNHIMQSHPALLLDFGGTLASIYPNHPWLYLRACQEFGVEADAARVRSAQQGGWDAYRTPDGPAHPHISVSAERFAHHKVDVIVERLKGAGIQGPREAIAARILALDTDPSMYRLYDDTIGALEALREQGFVMAVISNHEWELPALIQELGIAHYFKTIVTSARAGYRKPHPAIYRQTLAALGVPPAQAVMVGDEYEADVAGAGRLGIRAIYVDRAGAPPPDVRVPIIHTLTDLPDVLQRVAQSP